MDIQEMKDTVRRYYEVYTTGIIEDFKFLCNAPEQEIIAFKYYDESFSDVKLEATRMIGEGDQLVTEWNVSGVIKDQYMGIQAGGVRIDMNGVDIFQFTNGKIDSHVAYMDWMRLFEQLKVDKLSDLVL